MIEIKIKWEQDVWCLMGTSKLPVIVQGTVQGMFINREYKIMYLIMDCHVVYTKNEKYKKGEYVQSKDVSNADIGRTVFLSKKDVKNKIREMRNKM